MGSRVVGRHFYVWCACPVGTDGRASETRFVGDLILGRRGIILLTHLPFPPDCFNYVVAQGPSLMQSGKDFVSPFVEVPTAHLEVVR